MTNLATAFSAELEGIGARTIEVEVDLNVGLHAFNIVGLADKALSEAKERVNSALKNSGAKPPNRENRKITVNLAPAVVRKAGSQYDLAIALGYLVATKQIPRFDPRDKIFLGELALDGRVRSINGALNIAEMAARKKFRVLFLPETNAGEARAIGGLEVVPLRRLQDAIAVLAGEHITSKFLPSRPKISPKNPDFADIRGQNAAKRALTIAASGHHNLLMIGPPGVGKSLLAQALAGILPELTPEEAVEVTKIWSAAGMAPGGLLSSRPFRTPHQTASIASVIGGGAALRPGEISLAHCGVLFLDELPEFPKHILEALRGPLEQGAISIARAKGNFRFPAKFCFIAAMNPCPCGFRGDPEHECRCTAHEVVLYQRKISGPLLDRIDLQIRLARLPFQSFRQNRPEESSAQLRKAVTAARDRQSARFQGMRRGLRTNADMSAAETERLVHLSEEAEVFLASLPWSKISPRGYYRLLKTARTIADLDAKAEVEAADLAEAWSYRLNE